ncbi:21609_t:CDS:2, partial [Entrophospora sp. SA101]
TKTKSSTPSKKNKVDRRKNTRRKVNANVCEVGSSDDDSRSKKRGRKGDNNKTY